MFGSDFIPQFLYNFPDHAKLSYLMRDGILSASYAGYLLFKLKIVDKIIEIQYNNSYEQFSEVLGNDVMTLPFCNPDTFHQYLFFTTISKLMEIIDVLTPIYPRIYIKTSFKRPAWIMGAGFYGIERLKYIKINYSIRKNCLGPTSKVYGDLIRKHYAESSGKVMFFGEILGYTYYQSQEHGYDYDIEGNLVGITDSPDPLLWVCIKVL